MPTFSPHDLADASAALQAFLDANGRKDEAAMRSLLTRRTLDSGGFSGPQSFGAFPPFLGQPVAGDEDITVPIMVQPPSDRGEPEGDPVQVLAAVMTREDGVWKFDLAASHDRMMEALQSTMQDLGTAMSAAMEGMAGAIAGGFETITADDDEELDAMDELRELQELAAAEQAAADAAEAREEEQTPEPTEADLNDELFASAVASLSEVVPTWESQIELALGHHAPLTINWDTLLGQYPLIEGMVHAGVSPALGALCTIGFNRETKPLLADRVSRVRIDHLPGVSPGNRVRISRGELLFQIDASPELAHAAEGSLSDELLAALGVEVASEPAEPAIEIHEPELAGLTQEDRYTVALDFMSKLEELLREAGYWPGDAPENLEVRGAFGCENMAFTQWLGWVLIPRVREIVATRGSFPNGSMVATYAARELDGSGLSEIVSHLYRFDRFIEAGAREC